MDHVIPDFKGASDICEMRYRFRDSARAIMFECELARDQYKWQIDALELYVYEPNVWPDESVHCGKEQLLSGCWYVHQRGHNWRAPQRSGLDITCGNNSPEIHAGLLIRSISKKDEPKKDGPAIALQTIVRGTYQYLEGGWRTDENELLQSINGKSVFSSALKLIPCTPRSGDLWIGPRIFRSGKPEPPFGDFPLRIATWPMDSSMKKI